MAGDMAAQPFADSVAGAAELVGGGLEAVGAGEGDELLVAPVAVSFHAIEFPIGAVHRVRIDDARRCACSSGGAGAAPPCGGRSTP